MAKCIGFISDWATLLNKTANNQQQQQQQQQQQLAPPQQTNDLIQDPIKGEEYLCKKLQDVASAVLDIANDFILLKQTIEPNGIKLSCTEVRDYLMSELKQLNLDTNQITNNICNSKLTNFIKQKYFILYSCGVIAQLQQLLQIVGRLSELDQKIFLEEHQNPFISDESMIIHSLTSIWSASLNIMNNFQVPGRKIFSDEEEGEEANNEFDDYNFADQMEFSTTCSHYSKVFVMDLLITSWIQFNRLVRFDDLIRGLPLLCACHCRIFFTTLRSFGEEDRNKIISELLPLIIDYQSKPSLLTESLRQHNIVPLKPCYSLCDQTSLAYFVVWNIYSLSRIVKPIDKPVIENCRNILESSYDIAMKQFQAIIDQPDYHLSPHQEERHKLLTHIKFSLDKLDDTSNQTTTQ